MADQKRNDSSVAQSEAVRRGSVNAVSKGLGLVMEHVQFDTNAETALFLEHLWKQSSRQQRDDDADADIDVGGRAESARAEFKQDIKRYINEHLPSTSA